MEPKILAYYLPQFHWIEENNKWWGMGFTEWTNVKNGIPLSPNHTQPRRSLHNNYYNVMDRETVEWQTELCNKYGLYGFVYYHYWYEGRKLLERPAENLLNWKEIPQRFCFMWANHTWYKTNKGEKEILVKQTYGGIDDWISHFDYMRKFFKDERYMKIDNRPIFGIYIPNDIPDFNDMIDCWNNEAIKDGFDGLYIIESINSTNESIVKGKSNAGVIRQPNISRSNYLYIDKSILGVARRKYYGFKKRLSKLPPFPFYDYKVISQLEFQETSIRFENDNRPVYYGLSTGWDNTPRHGKYGQYTINYGPRIFKKSLEKIYKKSIDENKEFLFINAWNEWAEGMYLEPDEEFKYGYLEAIKEVVMYENN